MSGHADTKRVVEVLAAVPVLTAIAYSIGVAYSSGLYQRVGLDNLDLLGFSVQTYVTRSYAALDVFVDSIGWLTLLACAALAAAGVLWHATHAWKPLAVAGAVAALAVGLGNEREISALVLAVVVLAAILIWLHDESAWRRPSLAGLVVALWLTATVGAEAAGRFQACRITQGDDFATPLVRVVVDGPSFQGTNATPTRPIGDSGRVTLSDLRLFNTAPAGIIVYADDGPPKELIFLPVATILSVTSIPDGGNAGGDGVAGESC